MKKQLKISDEDKKLIAATAYYNLCIDMLEEFVGDDGNIFLSEYGDMYFKIWIEIKSSQCWVVRSFWREFNNLFSLSIDESKSIISRWVEDTYQLKGINIMPIVG